MPKPQSSTDRGATFVGAVLAIAWAVGLAVVGVTSGLVRQGDNFSITRWEVTRLTSFALGRTSTAFGRRTATDAEITHYFDLVRQSHTSRTRLITATDGAERARQQRDSDAAAREAARLRLLVEGRYEAAMETAVQRAGLVEHLPLYSGVSFVWPPVATGFGVPPHILIISPRDHIEIKDTTLLREDLSNAAALTIEQRADMSGVSALVDQIGGLGAYPSIADQDDSPLGLMQTVAHEWMHEYLIFHPLGARYADSNDMTLINETVADLAGRELGAMAFDALALPRSAPGPAGAASPSSPPDFNRTLHDLRLEVDLLLKEGRIDDAERRMNETQQLLAASGYAIRRINQAYFAFYGSYGDSAAASSPLGAKITAIRRESPTLKSFVDKMQAISRPADIDRLLQTAAR